MNNIKSTPHPQIKKTVPTNSIVKAFVLLSKFGLILQGMLKMYQQLLQLKHLHCYPNLASQIIESAQLAYRDGAPTNKYKPLTKQYRVELSKDPCPQSPSMVIYGDFHYLYWNERQPNEFTYHYEPPIETRRSQIFNCFTKLHYAQLEFEIIF